MFGRGPAEIRDRKMARFDVKYVLDTCAMIWRSNKIEMLTDSLSERHMVEFKKEKEGSYYFFRCS